MKKLQQTIYHHVHNYFNLSCYLNTIKVSDAFLRHYLTFQPATATRPATCTKQFNAGCHTELLACVTFPHSRTAAASVSGLDEPQVAEAPKTRDVMGIQVVHLHVMCNFVSVENLHSKSMFARVKFMACTMRRDWK